MRKVATDADTGNRDFQMIVDAFLQADGLPFSKPGRSGTPLPDNCADHCVRQRGA
ncbi:MAG: hypothetical protein V3R99_05295 [Thermoguttaceae bacterium]